MDAKELYRAGKLAEAVKAASEEVRKHPTDGDRRGFLVEMLCLSGAFDRADAQLETMLQQDPQASPGISLLRQLVRAEQWRRQFHSEGRVPEFLAAPTPPLRLLLEASVRLREGAAAEAAEIMARVEAERPRVTGTHNGQAFDDFRDLDDQFSAAIEVLTSTGKYFWIPTEQMVSIEFHPVQRPRDTLWRRARMVVRDGPEGEVFVPATYVPPEGALEAAMLGRVTDWVGGEGAPVRGIGQRTYLVGEESVPVMELGNLAFGTAAQ